MIRRLLILTDEIAPPAYAPRVTGLVQYLHSCGIETTVFSDRLPGVPPYKENDGEWYQTNYYGNRQRRIDYLADKILDRRELSFRRYIEQTTDFRTYDAIFCSTCYYFPLLTSHFLSRKYNLPLVVDLRDIAEQWGEVPYMTHRSNMPLWMRNVAERWFLNKNLSQRNKVLAAADSVITISQWHKQTLSRYNNNTRLVYNGYNPEDFYPTDIPTDKFRITYTGKIYDINFRDPRLMFQAVKELTAAGEMNADDVEIVFHIDKPSISVMQTLAADYGIAEICRIEGYIPKPKLFDLLHHSSVVLVLTCLSTPSGPHGILGTKFYEALGVEKPVLCVRSDEGALADAIRLTNAGVAAANADEAKHFLLDKYQEWKNKGFTRQPVNKETKRLFSREAESAEILNIIQNGR
ncbi:MAG: glycosyltransferase [Paludibacteraceae bacterium]|nr:glycosyltransferase [Paludibacteraceae bacterium]